METIGYYCDECRMKYVRHSCKVAMICGHDKAATIVVYAKAWGRGGEAVELDFHDEALGEAVSLRLYITQRQRTKDVLYSKEARAFWGMTIELQSFRLGAVQYELSEAVPEIYRTGDGRIPVGAWLNKQSPKLVRAFLERWESFNALPTWLTILSIKAEALEALSAD